MVASTRALLFIVLCAIAEVGNSCGKDCASERFCAFGCTSCSSCKKGYFNDQSGTDSCCACSDYNKWSPNGNSWSSCHWKTTCGPNTYTNSDYYDRTRDRVCRACPSGKTSSGNNQASCTEINGCTTYRGNTDCKSGGDSKAVCNDVKFSFRFQTKGAMLLEKNNKAEIHTHKMASTKSEASMDMGLSQYTCACSPGFVRNPEGTSCVDPNGCKGNLNTCKSKGDDAASCDDASPPDTGFSCTCSTGYEDKGGICTNIDGCYTGTDFTTCGLLGDGTAVCGDVAAPGVGNTCTCTVGYETATNGTETKCEDINGCAGSPCGDADKDAYCADAQAPLTGFSCRCGMGYSTADAGGACTDTNGCEGARNTCGAKGDSLAECVDNAAPLTGHNCTCSEGRHDNFGVCVDTNACADNDSCGSSGDSEAKCMDAVAPATGFGCKCSRGYEDLGGTCVAIDSCESKVCNSHADKTAICNSLAPPAIGNTCGCSAGFEEECSGSSATAILSGDGCVELEYALADCTSLEYYIREQQTQCNSSVALQVQPEPCSSGAGTCSETCPDTKNQDNRAPNADFKRVKYTLCCPKSAAHTGVEDKRCSCVDINGCALHPCTEFDKGASCTDMPAPNVGHSCSCSAGFHAVKGGCKDIDGCRGDPCKSEGDSGATCADAPAPQGGEAHTCNCTKGYRSQHGVCVNINSCKDANQKCAKIDTDAQCIDLKPPLDNFKCKCTVGYDEEGGECKDVDGCLGSPCSSAGDGGSTCTDVVAPGKGNTCSCTAGYAQALFNKRTKQKRCANIDSCKNNVKCGEDGDEKAICVDQPPPSATFHCNCGQDYHFNKATGSCQENLCLNPLIVNGGYITHGCKDGECPMMTNGQKIPAASIVCDEGFKAVSGEHKCSCGKHRGTCTAIYSACGGKSIVNIMINDISDVFV